MIQKPSSCPKIGSGITIDDWMIRSLNLRGTELIIYAIIQSFSKDGQSVFSGSLNYLSFWTGKSKPTILKILKNLNASRIIFIQTYFLLEH